MRKAAQCPTSQHHGPSWNTAFEFVRNTDMLNPLDLQFVFPHAQSSVPSESAESPESESDEQPVEVLACSYQRDDYSGSESEDSEWDEDGGDDRSGFSMHGYANKGWERKSIHQQNERFSSAQVKVRVSKRHQSVLLIYYAHQFANNH